MVDLLIHYVVRFTMLMLKFGLITAFLIYLLAIL